MKPNPTSRPSAPQSDDLAAGRSRAWLVALSATLPQLAAAAALPEPALRLAPAIATPRSDFPAQERDLLRVEYLAARTQATEADLVGDILVRVRRMDATVAEIGRLLEAGPQPGPVAASRPVAAPGAQPKPAAVPPEHDDPPPDNSLTMRALMASVILFLFWLLGKRHNYVKAQRIKAAAAAPALPDTPTEIPEGDALIAEPAPAVEPAVEALSGTVEPPVVAEAAVPPPLPPAPPPPERPEVAVAPDLLAPLDFEGITGFGKSAPVSEPATDPSLELAEIMVSMGLAHGAVQALTESIRDNPRRALYQWLKLLDVDRRSDMKEDFERAAQELRQLFNVQPEAWGASGGSISLEDYPHLAAKVQQLWPTPACTEFLTSLLEDNRGGTRHGFPRSVAEEILLLESMLNLEAAPAVA